MRSAPVLATLVLLASCSGDDQQAPDEVGSRIQEMLTAKYDAYKGPHHLPENAGILLHLRTPKGTWTATAGLPPGAGEDSHYRIASVSKTFTAAAIMLLDQQGKLRIGDRLTDPIPGTTVPYLPDSPNWAIPHKAQITIAQLLSHRAGVFDVFNDPIPETSTQPYAGMNYVSYVRGVLNEPDHQFTNDELLGVVSLNQLSYSEPAAAVYHYSDAGYMTLAKIIERVSGLSYDRFLATQLLAPMGLTQVTAPWSAYDSTLPAPYLDGFVSIDGTTFYPMTEDNMSCQVGPGNIIGTPGDMARWIGTLLSGKGPLSKEQVARMLVPPATDRTYALGIESYAGVGLGHSGAHPGYINLVAYHPVDDVAVVVVTPFIDYSGLEAHLALMKGAALEARAIAGSTTPWPLP